MSSINKIKFHISLTQGGDRVVISLKFLYLLVSLIILHILWDKVGDIIVISNVGNFIPGHNILKYRNRLNITGVGIG